MLKNCSLLVAIAMAVAVAANVIPTGIHQRATATNITYVGNNLYIGKRSGDDWLHRIDAVYAPANASRVVNATLSIVTYFNLTYIAVVDGAVNATLGAFPTLVSGGPGQTTTNLLFTSKIGQPVNSTVYTYVRY